jgi:iron(III) transport system substrate-binding protein
MTHRSPSLRRRDRRAVPVLLPLLVLGGLAAACGSGSTPASGGQPGTTLTLYSAQHKQTTDAILAAFTRATGIRVRVDSNDEDVLTAQVEQEGSRSPADLVYVENSNWLQQLDDRRLLARVDSSTLANVPRVDSATDGSWVGISARVSTMIYNPSRLSPSQLPRSVLDLAGPQWKGRIELAPAETDFWPIVSSVARARGQAAALAWLRGLKANAGSGANVPDNETLARDVNQGTTDLAVINSYYYYRLQAEVGSSLHARLASFEAHDPGYVQDVSGAAVLTSSKNQAAAQRLLAFMTSAAGETVLAHSDSFEYPLHPDVAASPVLTPFGQLQPATFTPADLGTGLDAKRLLQQVGLI